MKHRDTFALLMQVEAINAVDKEMRRMGRPVGAPDICVAPFLHWTARYTGRVLRAASKLPPDAFGRSLVHCGRVRGVNRWAVANA